MKKRQNNPKTTWTPEMKSFVIEKAKSGWPFKSIAETLSKKTGAIITKNACIGQAIRQNLRVSDFKVNHNTARSTCLNKIVTGRNPRATKAKLKVDLRMAKDEPTPLGPEAAFVEGCKWIHGDAASRDWHQCGHNQFNQSSWCQHHFARAFSRDTRDKVHQKWKTTIVRGH